MSLSKCEIQFRVIYPVRHHPSVRCFRPHPVEIPFDNKLDCVAKCCIDDCSGSHRQCRVHWQEEILMTCNEEGRKEEMSNGNEDNKFQLDLINVKSISIRFHC